MDTKNDSIKIKYCADQKGKKIIFVYNVTLSCHNVNVHFKTL